MMCFGVKDSWLNFKTQSANLTAKFIEAFDRARNCCVSNDSMHRLLYASRYSGFIRIICDGCWCSGHVCKQTTIIGLHHLGIFAMRGNLIAFVLLSLD